MTVAGIALAGAAGALVRYGVSALIGRPAASSFPWATFFVNVTGSLVLGLLVAVLGERVSSELRATLTIGFLGAYTTFSTFSLETFRLVENGAVGVAAAYVAASVVAGVGAVYLGWIVGRAV